MEEGRGEQSFQHSKQNLRQDLYDDETHSGAGELTGCKTSSRTPVIPLSSFCLEILKNLPVPSGRVWHAFSSSPVAQSDSLGMHKYFFAIFIITARSSVCLKITEERAMCNVSYQQHWGKKYSSSLWKNGEGGGIRAEIRSWDVPALTLVLNTWINLFFTFPTPSFHFPVEEKMESFLVKIGRFLPDPKYF